MEDLQNKNIFKIMCLFDDPKVIWDVKKEIQLPLTNPIYNKLKQLILLDKWIVDYNHLYVKWLKEDNTEVYNLSNSVIKSMISVLNKYNIINDEKIYFWYDVDRSIDESFSWENCPICGMHLINLGADYNLNNRFISPTEPLIFPFAE
jgi:hypothetical protein